MTWSATLAPTPPGPVKRDASMIAPSFATRMNGVRSPRVDRISSAASREKRSLNPQRSSPLLARSGAVAQNSSAKRDDAIEISRPRAGRPRRSARRPSRSITVSCSLRRLRRRQRRFGETTVHHRRKHLCIETRVGGLRLRRRVWRLAKQPLDRLVPFTRSVHSGFLYLERSGTVSLRSNSARSPSSISSTLNGPASSVTHSKH